MFQPRELLRELSVGQKAWARANPELTKAFTQFAPDFQK